MTPATRRMLERVVCTKKKPHARTQAMRIAEQLRAKGEHISAYRCPFTPGHWHVGHAPSMQTLKRVAEVLRDRHNGAADDETTSLDRAG